MAVFTKGGFTLKLKGNMVIELTDENTGEVETIEESNMVTNAVNNLLGINPMGIFYMMGGQYETGLIWNSEMLPICPNMIGGILLFSQALTEDVNNLYPSSSNLPVAYASNDVNATANVKRGSMNLTESKVLDNGYKFVWEFTPSQGNGTIAAVGLTSAQGGANAYGSIAGDATPFLQLKQISIGDMTLEEQIPLFEAVEMDYENGLLYSMQYATKTVAIKKYRIPTFDIGLNEKMNDTSIALLEEKVLTCSTFKFLGSYTPYGNFIDGFDGYWYGFSNQQNSSGNATMYWIKIKKEDYSFTEGSWSLSNATLFAVGSMVETDSYPKRVIRSVVRNGYLYVPKYDKTGIYKINISNSTDVTLVEFGFTSAMKPLGGSGSCENYLIMVGDLIIGWDFQVDVNDNVTQTMGEERFENLATPLLPYKQFLTCWEGSYGNEYHSTYLLTPYLATINNLSSAVVKNADKTMKITYTLTEEES